MAKIQISGQVLYSDLSPAANAEVKIYDLDLGPGGSHDTILTRTTNSQGKFSGQSSNWKDREGYVDVPLIGRQNILDILNLEFRVSVDGKTHKGPFILVGGLSAPIVLPFGPVKPVGKSNRDLVQVVELATGFVGAERALYKFIEASSEGVAAMILGSKYRKIHVLKGAKATLADFKSTLKAAANTSGVEAVDVLFNTHGLDAAVCFHEGAYATAAVKDSLNTLSSSVRNKFRAVFSTACFGSTHLSMWTQAGFSVADGAAKIYADAAVSFAPMLTKWANEGTFAEAIEAANAADLGNAADKIAIAYYKLMKQPANAAKIDSTRSTSGNTAIRIYSSP